MMKIRDTTVLMCSSTSVFGVHGVPEYTCGVQSFPDFLELMAPDDSSGYLRDCTQVTLDRQVGSRYFVSASNASKIVFLKDAAIKFLTDFGKDEIGNKLEKIYIC